jgi:hypothetical protein
MIYQNTKFHGPKLTGASYAAAAIQHSAEEFSMCVKELKRAVIINKNGTK